MYTAETKDKFIELRAKGYSFDKIAKQLSKAKQTLIDWSRELEEEIGNRKALELEVLYEKFFLLKEHRLKVFGEVLSRIQVELLNRDLSDVPTDKLLSLFLVYQERAINEYQDLNFKTSSEIREDKGDRELIEELAAPPISTQKKLKIVQK